MLRTRAKVPYDHQGFSTFLVATFERLLLVKVSSWEEPAHVQVLHEGLGIYYGLSRSVGKIFVVGRDTSAAAPDRSSSPGADQNYILEFDEESMRLVDATAFEHLWDMHEIRAGLDHLAVIRDDGMLFAIPWATGKAVPVLDFTSAIPREFRRDAGPPGREFDVHHFNSLHIRSGTSLSVLAHNWDFGSFSVSLSRRFGRTWQKQTTDLGHQAHDIFTNKHGMLVLDAGTQALVVRAMRGQKRIPVQYDGLDLFLRGMSVTRNSLFIGAGEKGPRALRDGSRSILFGLDRGTLQMRAAWDLGHHGNVTEVLCLSQEDFTDSNRIRLKDLVRLGGDLKRTEGRDACNRC